MVWEVCQLANGKADGGRERKRQQIQGWSLLWNAVDKSAYICMCCVMCRMQTLSNNYFKFASSQNLKFE